MNFNIVFSQSGDSIAFNRLSFTTNIIDYFPSIQLNTSNINVGAELYLKNKNSLSVNLGYIKSYGPSSGWVSINSLNTSGFKLQIERKHYFGKFKIIQPAILVSWPHIFQYNTEQLKNTGYYTSFHLSIKNTKTDRLETILDYIDNTPFPNTRHYKDNIYTVNRSIFSFNIKLGYHCVKAFGLTIDHAIGLGGQYISSISMNKLGLVNTYTNAQTELGGRKLFDKGSSLYPSILYQVCFGGIIK